MCDFYLFLTNVKESVLEMCGSLAFPTCIERKLIIFITKSRQIIPLTIHLYSFFFPFLIVYSSDLASGTKVYSGSNLDFMTGWCHYFLFPFFLFWK